MVTSSEPSLPRITPSLVGMADHVLRRRELSTMMQDPEMFPDPNVFKPERFMHDPFADFTLPFGFGRRQCPGMHVASQSLFIVIARYVIRLRRVVQFVTGFPPACSGLSTSLPPRSRILTPTSTTALSEARETCNSRLDRETRTLGKPSKWRLPRPRRDW